MFFDTQKMYILKVYSIQYTMWLKHEKLKKFPTNNINGTKNALFFFRELQVIAVLLFICDS